MYNIVESIEFEVYVDGQVVFKGGAYELKEFYEICRCRYN